MRPDPGVTPPEPVYGPETDRIDVTRGPAHGIVTGMLIATVGYGAFIAICSLL